MRFILFSKYALSHDESRYQRTILKEFKDNSCIFRTMNGADGLIMWDVSEPPFIVTMLKIKKRYDY